MIEYGLLIAERRGGLIQKHGAEVIREFVAPNGNIPDPAIDAEITLPETLEQELETGKEFVLYSQHVLEINKEEGPIKRGLVIASLQNLDNKEILEKILLASSELTKLEELGFIDEDPPAQA